MYKELNPAQKLLYSKVLDRLFICQSHRAIAFTDFLDPVSCASCIRLLGAPDGITIRAFGGASDCERQMLGFAPEPEELPDDRFPIARLRVTHNSKFNKAPRHQDLMGSVLGLGIDRSRVGDIVILDGYADVFAQEDIAGYILTQLDSAGRTPVRVERVALNDGPEQKTTTEKTIIVASLRLDAVVAAAFRLSRSQAQAMIAAEKVMVNWQPAGESGKNICLNDMINLRGRGRVKIAGVEGKTKKDRICLKVTAF